jgi:hypothetical protein
MALPTDWKQNVGSDRVARFFLAQHTNTVKNMQKHNKKYQWTTKYTK